ncbi:glucosyltransferase domain-containing protein [Citrobacter sp. OP27]
MDYIRFVSEKRFSNQQSFFMLLSISAIFMLPIINANIYYVDDISRAQTNLLGWSGLGRPVSDLLFMMFSISHRGVDVSPLPQALSILVNALSSYVLLRCISKENSINSILLSAIPVVSPLYIQNMLYRYDSLSMSLAVLFSIYASYIALARSKKLIHASILIILSFCLYQASMPIFPILIMLGACKLHKDNKPFLIFILKWAVIYLVSTLVYKIISGFFIASSRGELIFSKTNWVNMLDANINSFYWLFKSAYGHHGEFIFASLISLSLIFSTILLIKNQIHSHDKIKSLSQSLLITVLPIISVLTAAIFISVLSESFIVPRVALGFGFVISFLIYTLHIKSHNNIVIFSCSFIVLFISICSSYAVVSATKKQYDGDLLLTAQIKTTIENNQQLKDLDFHTYGRVNESIYSRMVSKSYPIASTINARLYDWTLATQLSGLGAKNIEFSFDRNSTFKELVTACSAGKIEENTPLYKIYTYRGNAFIVLGKEPKECRVNASS